MSTSTSSSRQTSLDSFMSRSTLRRVQQRGKRSWKVAANEVEQAVALRLGNSELLHQGAADALQQLLLRCGDPSHRGRAVDTVDSRDVLRGQRVDVLQAQQVALAIGQRRHRGLESGHEGTAVPHSNVVELEVLPGWNGGRNRIHGRL